MMWRGLQKRHGGMKKKLVTYIRYGNDGRKGKRVETATERCGSGDVGQQEHRKWSDGKPERGLTDRGRRGDEGVGKIK